MKSTKETIVKSPAKKKKNKSLLDVMRKYAISLPYPTNSVDLVRKNR